MNFWKLCRLTSVMLSLFLAAYAAAPVAIPVDESAPTASSQTVKPTTIIFDLGGVLFDTSRTGISGELHCTWDFMQYALRFNNPSKIKDVAFSALDGIFGKQETPEGNPCAMADGIVMPKMMCEWMCGARGCDIISAIDKKLEDSAYDHLFTSALEKRLVKRVLDVLFNPAIMARHTHPIKQGLEILKRCAQQNDLTLMVLSNYAADAFEELYNRKEAQKVFSYFAPEKMIISGCIGHMKPYHSMYDYIKKEFHLDPASCIVIDDQKENITAAKNAGFRTIMVKKGNFGAVRKRLERLGAIPA